MNRVTELTFDYHDEINEIHPGLCDVHIPSHMVATAEIDGLVTRFVWSGAGQIHVQTGNSRPFYDWNVWDYQAKGPSIEYTLESFESYIRERLLDDEDLDVLRDMRIALVPA